MDKERNWRRSGWRGTGKSKWAVFVRMEYLADTVGGFDRLYSPEITVSGSEHPPQVMVEVMR